MPDQTPADGADYGSRWCRLTGVDERERKIGKRVVAEGDWRERERATTADRRRICHSGHTVRVPVSERWLWWWRSTVEMAMVMVLVIGWRVVVVMNLFDRIEVL
uniref:Uncharacterized protein n=1 Tax=Helianthus annuus TaxID=4232 RepID=A0A251UF87_HELAN